MRSHLACSALLAWVASSTAAAAPASPMGMLKHSNDDVRRILKEDHGGVPTAAHKEQIKKIVNGFLDYEELGKRSLAANWDKITPAQRTEFVQVFRDLIEKNYVRQLRSNVDYVIEYKSEDVKGPEGTVHSVVKTERRGRQSESTIDYKLLDKGGRWAVYDVITDDVSLLRNYRSQFARIIDREGFPALMGKMKKKLAETTE
jgi:phospholipid transport system substrate-binding protein